MEWIQLAQDNTVADSCQYTYIKKQRIYTDYLSHQQLVNDCLVEFETNTTWKILSVMGCDENPSGGNSPTFRSNVLPA